MASKVFFSDFRTSFGKSIPVKLDKLLRAAGMLDLDLKDKYVAIKINFGEYGNLAYLRPAYARAVAELVKEAGGIPFLTDCNTLYPGMRKDAIEHMECAELNGFTLYQCGCPIIIADGLKGSDDVEIPVDGGVYVEAAKIGRAIADADAIISLNHFKGHEQAGFGGAMKNLGMGCGSRRGKAEMHSNSKPAVNQDACIGCRACAKQCANNGLVFEDGKARIDEEACLGCGRCIASCKQDAIMIPWDSSADMLNYKMAEYTKAVIDGKPSFHISIACDISPYCDCHAENDAAIVPNIGMFASADPVAIDLACADAVNASTPNAGSYLADQIAAQKEGSALTVDGDVLKDEAVHENNLEACDHFGHVHPITNWKSIIDHAERIGLGTREYKIVEV